MPRKDSAKRRRIFSKTGGCCAYCGIAMLYEGPWCYEHMLPRRRGGKNDDANIVPACASCNSKKRGRTPEEYRAWIKFTMQDALRGITSKLTLYPGNEHHHGEALQAIAAALDRLEPVEIRFAFESVISASSG